MKRKFGVLLLLLPLPNTHPPLTLLRPVLTGDTLDGALVNRLLLQTPQTVPLIQLRGKKLVLNLFSPPSGSLIAVFPTLEAVQTLPHGRVHVVLLSNPPWQRLDTFLNSNHDLLSLPLPVSVPEQLHQLLAFGNKPHALVLHPGTKIHSVSEGYYVNAQTIRQATGLRKQSRALPT